MAGGGNIASGIESPLTTKGDLFTFAGSDARLAVGSGGQILISDPSTPTGLRWANGSGTVDATAWHESLDSFGSEKKIGTSDNFDFVLYRNSVEGIRIGSADIVFSEPIIVQNAGSPITVPYHSYFRFDVNGSNLVGNVNTSTGTGAFCGYEATTNPDATGSWTVYMLITGENYSSHGFSGYEGILGIGTQSTALRLYTPGAQDIIFYPDTTEIGRVTDLGGGNYGLRLERPAANDSTILLDIKNGLSAGVSRMNVTNDAGAFSEFGINGSAVGATVIQNNESYIETIGGGLALLGGTSQILRLGANDALWARCLQTGEFLFGPDSVVSGGRFSSGERVEVIDDVDDELGYVSWNKNNGTISKAYYTAANDALHEGQFGITSSSGFTPSGGLLADEVFVRGLANNVVLSALGSNKLRFLTNGTVRYEIDGNGNQAWFGATPVGQQTVTGSRASGAALASFLTVMAATGIIIDGTTV